MIHKIHSLSESMIPFIDGTCGKLWKVNETQVVHGSYAIWKNTVIKETLHENYNNSWLKYWLTERGDTFGGVEKNQLKIIDNGKRIKLINRPSNISKEKTSAYIFQYTYDHNFHHFLITALPRLNQYLELELEDTKVLVRDDTPKYQLEIIEHLIPKDMIMAINPMKTYEFENLYIPAFPQSSSIDLISQFYSKYFNKVKVQSCLESNKKFYLSRDDSPNKRFRIPQI